MSASTTANGTLIRDEIERILIQPLSQRSEFLRLGCPTFTSNGEPIKIPTLTSELTLSYVAEGSAVNEVTPTTSEIELLGSSVYAWKNTIKMTTEVVSRSFLDVENQFAARLVTDTARSLDNAFFSGSTAVTGSPVGLFNMTGFTNAGTAAGTALAKGDLIDMTEDYLSVYADEATATWAMSPANWTRIRKFSSDNGTGILEPSLADGAPSRLLGYPVTVTGHAPDSAIMLFDRAQVAVGHDVSRDQIRLLDQTYAATDEVGVMVQGRWDIKPMNAEAIVKLTIS